WNATSRPSAFRLTTGSLFRVPLMLCQSDQLPLGESCHLCHMALSLPRTNTSCRPSVLLATAMLLVSDPPRPVQPVQLLLPGALCWLYQRAFSVPRTKTTIRPSALRPTAGSLVSTPPSLFQSDQFPPVVNCHLCQSW